MKLSVSSYSFHSYIKEGKLTQLSAIRKAAELGFEGIEFTDLAPVSGQKPTLEEQLAYAKELRTEAKTCGIEIVAYLIGANLYTGDPQTDAAEVARVKGQVDVAAALGVKLMRHDVCRTERFGDRVLSFDRMLPTIAANAREITEYAASLGIRTCSENHGFIAQDSDRVEKLYHAVAHENYGILVDMGNFACADEDSARAVSRLAPYAIHAHAKDFLIFPYDQKPEEGLRAFQSRGCRWLVGCAVGDGSIPTGQCVAILKKAGYNGWLTIEFEGNGDCVEGIAKGFATLKKYLTE
ncbi:MAG: sugar phosphate isomerase/epimerase [Ruminococcaceae bacterium]|nr:sugar phosphate isomerase/epimerase [Oscillospiraceae bacterium]